MDIRSMSATIALVFVSTAPISAQETQSASASVVQAHVDAYRAKNMSAFLGTFSQNAVVVFDGMTFQGRAQIRSIFSANFGPEAPALQIRRSGEQNGIVWLETAYDFGSAGVVCCGYSEYSVSSGKITKLVVTGPN